MLLYYVRQFVFAVRFYFRAAGYLEWLQLFGDHFLISVLIIAM